MSVIWSGITEQGAVVPVQVDESGKVIATAAVSGEYVKITGDTMTGPLVLPGNPSQELEAATKGYVDSSTPSKAIASAWASVDFDGSLISSYNIARSSRSSEGVYIITFAQPFTNNAYMPVLSCLASARYAGVSAFLPDSMVIGTYRRSNDSANNSNFSLLIYAAPDAKNNAYSELV